MGIEEVDEGVRIVTFMHHDLGYTDSEQKMMQPLDNPFIALVLLAAGSLFGGIIKVAFDRSQVEPTMNTVALQSILTCPQCGFSKAETMPVDACQFYYQCGNCGTLLRPKAGDCCVFCSYGSAPCPPIQQQRGCFAV